MVLRWSYRDVDAPHWGVAGVLEMVKDALDSVAPETGARRFEIFDQLCDFTPDGVPCDVVATVLVWCNQWLRLRLSSMNLLVSGRVSKSGRDSSMS